MEMIENYMVMDRPEYNTNWEEYYEAMAEKSDVAYQDKVFDEMMKKEEKKAVKNEKVA